MLIDRFKNYLPKQSRNGPKNLRAHLALVPGARTSYLVTGILLESVSYYSSHLVISILLESPTTVLVLVVVDPRCK
jgi:hypothetical protein